MNTQNEQKTEETPEILEKTETPECENELKAIREELESCRSSLSELEDKYKRVLAEYDNFRKRSQKEREGLYSDILATSIASFLPVLDNLERAVLSGTDAEKKGAELIAKQFLDIMNKHGVTPCGEVGDTFDPNIHNAVIHVDDESFGENVICEVLMRGYIMNERVVRHAMVKVAN